MIPISSGYSKSIQEHVSEHHKDYSIWLTTYGRRTGKPRMVQIWFAAINNEFYILSRHGLDSWWAKNLRKNPGVVVNIGGRALAGTSELVDDRDLTDLVWNYYRGKYRMYPQIYIFSWKKRKLFRIRFQG